MRVLKTVAIFLFIIGIASCSDNGSDAVENDPPQLPDLESVQPDTEFFSSASGSASGTAANATSTTLAFDQAQQVVQATVNPLFSLSDGLALPLFQQAKNIEPEFNDGVWEWTYSYAQAGQSIEVKLTATVNESAGDVDWDLFLSASGTDGFSFDDYRFMSGNSAIDGSQGDWKIYPFEPGGAGEPVITFEWTKTDDNTVTATYNIEDPNSTNVFTMNFDEEGPDHTLTITATEVSIEIYWNTDNNTGYIVRNGEKSCWDSNFQDTSCS